MSSKPKVLSLDSFHSLCDVNPGIHGLHDQLKAMAPICRDEFFLQLLPLFDAEMKSIDDKKAHCSHVISFEVLKMTSVDDLIICARSTADLRNEISRLNSVQKELQQSQNDKRQQHFQPYNDLMEELRRELSSVDPNSRLPFQLEYLIRTPTDDTDDVVTFLGGDITDAEGISIFKVFCYFCLCEIQSGPIGENLSRWKSVDSKSFLCTSCAHAKICLFRAVLPHLDPSTFHSFEIDKSRRKTIESNQSETSISCQIHPIDFVDPLKHDFANFDEYLALLKQIDPNWSETFFVEYDTPIFLRLAVSNDSIPKLLNSVAKSYNNRPCFQQWAPDSSELTWMSYDTYFGYVNKLSRWISRHLPCSDSNKHENSFAILVGDGCVNWYLIDMACAFASNWIVVGVHTSWSKAEFKSMLTGLGVSSAIVFVQEEYLEFVVDGFDDLKPKLLIVWRRFDLLVSSSFRTIDGVDKADLGNILSSSEREDDEVVDSKDEDEQNQIYSLMFTSGSTGTPKAAIISSKNWGDQINGRMTCCYQWPLVNMSFMPPFLMGDRLMVWGSLCNGGRVAFPASTSQLFLVTRILRPTMMSAPPAFWTSALGKLIQGSSSVSDELTEVNRVRDIFGDRLTLIGTGGANVTSSLIKTLKRVFGDRVAAQIGENYGSTEVGNIASNGIIDKNVQVWIDPIEGMEDGTGEICVKTLAMFSGYWGVSQSTCFTDDGYYRTGDLGKVVGKEIKLFGRCKTAVKLSNGTFFSPEKLEGIIGDAILFKNSIEIQASRISIVSSEAPELNHVTLNCRIIQHCVDAIPAGGSQGLECDLFYAVFVIDDCSASDELNQSTYLFCDAGILGDIDSKGLSLIILEPAASRGFDKTGVLGVSGKLVRSIFRNRYHPVASFIFNSSSREIANSVSSAIIDSNSYLLPAAWTNFIVTQMRTLSRKPLPAIDVVNTVWHIMGDSLAVIRLCHEIVVGMSKIVNLDAANLQALLFNRLSTSSISVVSDWIVSALRESNMSPHGDSTDFCQDIIDDISSFSTRWPKFVQSANFELGSFKDIVLLTGSTGFVGSNILHLLFTGGILHTESCGAISLCKKGLIVACIVRSADASLESLVQRLVSALERYVNIKRVDAEELLRASLASGSLIVLKGDLSRPAFDCDRYAEICSRTAVIIHAAAEVNFLTPYALLRESTVSSTENMLKFWACSGCRLVYLSTMSVFGSALQQNENTVNECTYPLVSGLGSGCDGYTKSKFVSEKFCTIARDVLESQGHLRYLTIARLGFVSWGNSIGGLNKFDWLTRILISSINIHVCLRADNASNMSLISVDDVATLIVILAMLDRVEPNVPLEIVHLLGSKSIELNHIFQCISETVGRDKFIPCGIHDFSDIVGKNVDDPAYPLASMLKSSGLSGVCDKSATLIPERTSHFIRRSKLFVNEAKDVSLLMSGQCCCRRGDFQIPEAKDEDIWLYEVCPSFSGMGDDAVLRSYLERFCCLVVSQTI